jgi:hypothetical protein
VSAAPHRLVEQIRARLAASPCSFYDVVRHFESEAYRDVLAAWGDLRATVALLVDTHGRYRLPEVPSGDRSVGAVPMRS